MFARTLCALLTLRAVVRIVLRMETALRSIGRRFAVKAAHLTAVLGALICALIIGQATETVTYADRPDVTTSAAALLEAHDCWTGDAPADMAGKVPGHVVVSVDGTPRYAGERMVAKAFAQVFDGADHGLTIHGFCR